MTTTAPTPTLALHDDVELRPAAVLGIAALVVALAQVLPAGPGRAVVVAPIMLLVPGWAAYHAVFGRSRPTDPVVSITFVIALGMGVLIANGLLVNALGIRLSSGTLVAGPGILAGALLVVAHFRGGDTTVRVPARTRPQVQFTVIVLLIALLIGAVSVNVAANRLPAPASPPFAELSFASPYATSPGPLTVVAGQIVTLPLQMRLDGLDHVLYREFVFLDGKQVHAVGVEVDAPLWTGSVKVAVPAGKCLHQAQIVFVPPRGSSAKLLSLDAYMSVNTGVPCRP